MDGITRSTPAIFTTEAHFKSINDSFGHDIGDDVLETSARLLKDCIRSEDFIARYGGDEFFIILNVANQADLEVTVCRIKNYIKMHNESGDLTFKIEFSMGYAVYDQHARLGVEAFEKLLDVLMYKDKRINKEIEQNRQAAH